MVNLTRNKYGIVLWHKIKFKTYINLFNVKLSLKLSYAQPPCTFKSDDGKSIRKEYGIIGQGNKVVNFLHRVIEFFSILIDRK